MGRFLFAAVDLLVLAAVLHGITAATRNGTLVRNSAIGIRTRATRASPAAWEAGHRAALPKLRAAVRIGYAAAVASAGLGFLGVPALPVVPGAAFAAVLALVLRATREANRAAREVG